MEKDTTTYVGLDDSKRKLVVAILRPGEREPEQREMPKEPHLIQRLFRRLTREGAVAACYEAGVSGYDLYRQITACGVTCQVIAPALTPRRPCRSPKPRPTRLPDLSGVDVRRLSTRRRPYGRVLWVAEDYRRGGARSWL